MLFVRNLLKLPSPVDLGRSTRNALPSRRFTPNCKDYCWEDHDVELQTLHPVKYWISKTFADFAYYKIYGFFANPVKHFHYWFVSHFFPKRRYHMLDLRQSCDKNDIDNFNCYRYGWADVPEKMLYAIFNLLGEYINKENPNNLKDYYTQEQIDADASLKLQQHAFDEAHAIYHWWRVERKEEQRINSELLHAWSEARHSGSKDEKVLWKQLRKSEKDQEVKLNKMIARLMKVRTSLWT